MGRQGLHGVRRAPHRALRRAVLVDQQGLRQAFGMPRRQLQRAGFACDNHTGQRRLLQLFENLRVERRQGQEMADALFADQLRQARRVFVRLLFRQVQGAALAEGPEDPRHRAVERERRQHQEAPQRGPVELATGAGRGTGVGMADHHALGLAGGTGGVDHVGQVAGGERHGRGLRLGGRQALFQGQAGNAVRHLDAVGQGAQGDQALGAGVMQHERQALGRVAGVQR